MSFQVFPVRVKWNEKKQKNEKHPAIPKGSDWRTHEAAPDDIALADNVGVVVPDGVVVIDLDTRKGVTREAIETALGCALDWDAALLQQTITGGQHYGFCVPSGATLQQGSDLFDVDGFDTRCAGRGWICTGKGYTDETIAGLPEGLAPDWLPPLPKEALDKLTEGGDPFTSDDDDNALELAIASQPLEGITIDDMRGYIKRLPESDVNNYDTWLKVGMACHHQTAGGSEGAKLWAEWSKGAGADYDVDEIKSKWRSFKGGTRQTTFAYVIKRAGGKAAIAGDKVEALCERATKVDTLDAYEAFKREVQGISEAELPSDFRAMVAADLATSEFCSSKKLTKTDIKKALVADKKTKAVSAAANAAEWAQPWVYVEVPCEFAHTELNYSIKREAFNAKYDREAECLIAEKAASALCLNDYRIPCVVDKMFWPGAGRIIEHEGKDMLNTYNPCGAAPCDDIDEDGQDVIDRFLQHLRFTLSDEREQRIMLDWLAYVVQNPGKRVGWALLLQGAQGTGKSYFCVLLQMILGDLVTNLDPTAIAGRFTGWAHGSLVTVVEEIRISGTNRYEVLDRMKPFITNETVQIEEKGRDHRTVPNFTSYLLLTNHKDAIPIASGDRRYCVLFSRVQSEEQLYSEFGGEAGAAEYFDTLFTETRRRPDALCRYLLDHKASPEFTPSGRAPETKARQMMMAVSASPERLALEDAINEHECAVINDQVIDITYLNNLCSEFSVESELPKTRALTAILLEMGYEQIEGRRVKINKTKKLHYVWNKPGFDGRAIVKEFHDDPNFVPF